MSYPGTVYLLHFAEPLGNPDRPNRAGLAQHYIGWAKDGRLLERIAEDQAGGPTAPKIMQAAARLGIASELARLWEGGPEQERRIKRQGGASRFCPLCGVKIKPRPVPPRSRDGRRRPPWWPPIGAAPRPRLGLARAAAAWSSIPEPEPPY